MTGCFGNSRYDRHLERELDSHLELEEWNNREEDSQEEGEENE